MALTKATKVSSGMATHRGLPAEGVLDGIGITTSHLPRDKDCTEELVALEEKAFLAGLPLKISGGGVLLVSDSITSRVPVFGDGITTINQTGDRKSTLVLIADGLVVKDVIISPTSVNNSISQGAVEIRGVNHCSIVSCKVRYKGSTETEGNGFVIMNGNHNTILDCHISGANLREGVYHNAGGNDIAVYGNSNFNTIAFNHSIGRNIRAILQQTSLAGQFCDHNTYIGNTADGNIGYGHICYELVHTNNSMRGTRFIGGSVKNIEGSAKIPPGSDNPQYVDKKIFGAGVYNQGGVDTIVSGYTIENVCLQTETGPLPMAGVSSTSGSITVTDTRIKNSKRCGVKIASGNIQGDTLDPSVVNVSIDDCTEEGVYFVGMQRVRLSDLNVRNSRGAWLRCTSDETYALSSLVADNITAESSSRGLIQKTKSVSLDDVTVINGSGGLTVETCEWLKLSGFTSQGGTGIGLDIASSVTDGTIDAVHVSGGVTGVRINAPVRKSNVISTGNTTDYTGTYGGLPTASATSSLSTLGQPVINVPAGEDVTTITGGAVGDTVILRATASRTLVHNSANIIIKGGSNLVLSTNGTAGFVCIGKDRWLQTF